MYIIVKKVRGREKGEKDKRERKRKNVSKRMYDAIKMMKAQMMLEVNSEHEREIKENSLSLSLYSFLPLPSILSLFIFFHLNLSLSLSLSLPFSQMMNNSCAVQMNRKRKVIKILSSLGGIQNLPTSANRIHCTINYSCHKISTLLSFSLLIFPSFSP